MGDKLRRLTIAVLLAGSAAVLVAAPAEASREPKPTTTTTTEPSYVPPPKYGQNPHPVLPEEQNPYAPAPVVPVVLPQLPPDGGSIAPNPGDQNAGDNSGRGVAPGETVLGQHEDRAAAPSNGGAGFVGGLLSRTGANTLPLVRAGLAALALGAGLIVIARRRRAGTPSA